jgi:hypothetical protein
MHPGGMKLMADPTPDPRRCKRAIKILEQFERLARKFDIKLTPERLERLKRLRHTGRIKSTDLPAKLLSEFPAEFVGMTLGAIRNRCGKR